MFSVKSVVSNVPLSNAGSPGFMTGSLDLVMVQHHQTQCLSNDDAVTRVRTEGKAMDDFRVVLADTFKAVFVNAENSEERIASKPAGFQPGLTAACSFGYPGVRQMRDIDNRVLLSLIHISEPTRRA